MAYIYLVKISQIYNYLCAIIPSQPHDLEVRPVVSLIDDFCLELTSRNMAVLWEERGGRNLDLHQSAKVAPLTQRDQFP